MEVFIVTIVAVFVTLVSTLIQKKLTDVDLVKSLKAETKRINKDMKEVREDPKKTNEMMSKSFEIQKKMMGQTMKPMMISSVVVFVAFFLLSTFFEAGVTLVQLPFSLPFIGNGIGWFGIFIIASIISSLIFRKVLDVGF